MPKNAQLVTGKVVSKLRSIYTPKSLFLPLVHAVFQKEKALKENDLMLKERKCKSKLERKDKSEKGMINENSGLSLWLRVDLTLAHVPPDPLVCLLYNYDKLFFYHNLLKTKFH